MNISNLSSNLAIAKTCVSNDKRIQKVIYSFSEEFHSLYIDKKDILEAQIQACEKFAKYSENATERLAVEKELFELRMALDLLT